MVTDVDYKNTKIGKCIIIDGIKEPNSFKESSDIKREIKKFKDINIKFAYQLSRGGIAVHTDDENIEKQLKEDWPKEAFGNSGEVLCVHGNDPVLKCVLKNVPIVASEEELRQEICKQLGVIGSIRRLRYRDTGKPLKVVEVTCSSKEDLMRLIQGQLCIRQKGVFILPYRSKRNIPTRCYNCQAYDHVAKMCINQSICENCGENHQGNCINTNKKCANCKSAHKASSKTCPAYLALLEKLTLRH